LRIFPLTASRGSSTADAARLVNFRFSTADVRRESDGRTYRALVRFRAVTEPE